MIYNLEDIKEAVRVVLDENQVSDNMMDMDTLSVDEIIRSKVEEAVNNVHLLALKISAYSLLNIPLAFCYSNESWFRSLSDKSNP